MNRHVYRAHVGSLRHSELHRQLGWPGHLSADEPSSSNGFPPLPPWSSSSSSSSSMAPSRSNANGADRSDNCPGLSSDRKTRKPLVERKRRARINESLQELRVLIADAELQSKMENAEVLEMTVKRVESILQSRAQEVDAVNREACERFAAGYIQCMHDVHTFVSSCPGIDPTVAAELLNHLLESMPLNDQDRLRLMLPEAAAEEGEEGAPGNNSTWSVSESMYMALVSPAPSTASTDDLCSDLDETEVSSSEEAEHPEALSFPAVPSSKSVWRPW